LRFDPNAYGDEIAAILALDQNGNRLIPLVSSECSSEQARARLKNRTSSELFPSAAAPDAALSGLWLYFSCFEESHQAAQDLDSSEGSFWHGILHRQEPDSANAAYWFRRVVRHPVFAALHSAAAGIVRRNPQIEFRLGAEWDPFAFIAFAERAREQPGSASERAALEIQRAEWQLLFDYCARPAP
jgi:hypothetical protein